MAAGGIKTPAVLDELESHLLEEIRERMAAGDAQADAFEFATGRIGTPVSLRAEFNKISGTTFLPVVAGAGLWAGLTLLAAGLMLGRVFDGKTDMLLFAHAVTLTAGYLAAFLSGGFAAYHFGLQWFEKLSPTAQDALQRATLQFSGISAALTITGLVLGMVWSGQNRGVYWTGSAREVGTLIASIWFLGTWAIQQFRRKDVRVQLLASICGNVAGALGWFGAGIFQADPGLHRLAHYWPLQVFIGAHLLLFAVAFSHRFEAAKS